MIWNDIWSRSKDPRVFSTDVQEYVVSVGVVCGAVEDSVRRIPRPNDVDY